MQTLQKWIAERPLTAFFGLAYLMTWLGSSLHYFSSVHAGKALPVVFNLPGALVWYYGPFLAAVMVSACMGGKARVLKLFDRIFTWRVDWRWYVFILLYPICLHLAVVGLDRWLGGPTPVFFQAAGVAKGNPWLVFLLLLVVQIFLRGIGEETGWRAFALPQLQSRMDSTRASLWLGVLWAGWHFHPANFATLLSTGGIFVFFNIVATTFLFTWVFNQTNRSLLIAILFHASLNMAEWIIPIGIADASLNRQIIHTVLLWAGVGILIFWRGQQLDKPGQAAIDRAEGLLLAETGCKIERG